MTLPALLDVAEVLERLKVVFPQGLEERPFLTREMAARAVFVFLYGGMVEGGPLLRPSHIYFFTEEQSRRRAPDARLSWVENSMRQGFRPEGRRWYADTTREPIRDETLRFGLVQVGAVRKVDGVPTTSSKPIYFLAPDFAALFDPALKDGAFAEAAAAWRDRHLSSGARARLRVVAAGRTRTADAVLVTLPDGRVEKLAPGLSSLIAKGVIEDFAPRFLGNPVLLWLSESGQKVRLGDDALANDLGLDIDPSRTLPDVILVSVGDSGATTVLVFVEVVATDGAMTEARKNSLLDYVRSGGFPETQCVFGTAFEDRGHPAFRKVLPALAWGSFAWFRAEPDRLMCLYDAPVDVLGWPFRGATRN